MRLLEKKCNLILCAVFGLVMAVFSTASFIFSRCAKSDADPFYNSFPIYRIVDNPLINLLVPLFFILLFIFLNLIFTGKKLQNDKKIKADLLVIALAGGLFSLWIVKGGIRTPGDDQAQVYSAAALFNMGNYINLSPGGYVDMYVQQLGYISYVRVIFLLFGNYNFRAVQYINCLWIVGIIYLSGRCLRHFCDAPISQLMGSLFMAAFLPVHYLSSWVYGDIPFYFFQFLFFDSYFEFEKTRGRKAQVILICSGTCALVFRKNALIMLIACTVAILFSDHIKVVKKVALISLVLMIPLFTVSAFTGAYRHASGYELKGGIPAISWISMGMNEEGKAGWFYDYSVPIYYMCENDRELAAECVKNDIKERAAYLISNPKYALGFYCRKLFTQWNDPFYNTERKAEVDDPDSAQGITIYLIDHEKGILRLLSSYQFMIYVMTLLYSIIKSRKQTVSENIILIYLTGGVLFSLIWEANSRYVLQYVLMLFPMAVMGISTVADNIFRAKNEKDFAKGGL